MRVSFGFDATEEKTQNEIKRHRPSPFVNRQTAERLQSDAANPLFCASNRQKSNTNIIASSSIIIRNLQTLNQLKQAIKIEIAFCRVSQVNQVAHRNKRDQHDTFYVRK